MKKFFLPLMLLLSMFTASITSCSGDSDDEIIANDSIMAIYQTVADVTSVAGEIFYLCDSPDEAKKYLDKLRDTKGVVDAWIDSQTMCVDVEGWGIIPYFFDLEEPEETTKACEKELLSRASEFNFHTRLNPKRVCIANQMINDKDANSYKVNAELVEALFKDYNYEATPVSPTLDFYSKGMYEYDIVFLITHGKYEKDGLHWFMTSEEKTMKSEHGVDVDWLNAMFTNKYKDYPKDKVKFGAHSEQRDGIVKTPLYYLMVSDKFIDDASVNFNSYGQAIVMTTICKALKGNDNMAQAFIKRGAGVFVGYDEDNNIGADAIREIFIRMLGGMSLKNAISDLPSKYRHADYKGTMADLNSIFADPETDFCINTIKIDNIENLSTENKIEFKVISSIMITQAEKEEEGSDFTKNMFFGLYINNEPSTKGGKQLEPISIADCTINDNRCYYTQALTSKELKPETTYYVWPYLFDGTDFCLGDMEQFKTGKLERESIDQIIPDDIRKTMEPYITIYDGNNPPNIEGIYVIDPMEVVYDMTGNYQPGEKQFAMVYFEISNQNTTTNTLDYREQEVINGVVGSESKGEGAFISGEGNNFSVYFNTTGVTHLDTYDVTSTHALVISGTKTNDGIRDLRYSFVMVDKGDDPEEMIINKGDFRVFKDGDNWAEKTHWSFTRSPQITVRDGQIITPWKVTKRKQIH